MFFQCFELFFRLRTRFVIHVFNNFCKIFIILKLLLLCEKYFFFYILMLKLTFSNCKYIVCIWYHMCSFINSCYSLKQNFNEKKTTQVRKYPHEKIMYTNRILPLNHVLKNIPTSYTITRGIGRRYFCKNGVKKKIYIKKTHKVTQKRHNDVRSWQKLAFLLARNETKRTSKSVPYLP